MKPARPGLIGRCLWRFLLATLPRDFRQRFGAEIEQVLAQRWREEDSWWRRWVLWLRSSGDLATNSIRLHFAPPPPTRIGPNPSRSFSMDWLQDILYARRSLARSPGLVLTVILTLGVGIGATTAIYSAVDAVLLRALPYPDPDQLVLVWENDRLRGTRQEGVSGPDFEDWRAQSDSFASLAAAFSASFTLTGEGEPERITGASVSHELFSSLGGSPQLGRTFSAIEEREGSAVAVLGHDLWTRRFGADRGVLGQSVRLDGQPYIVLGVMPPSFAFPSEPTDLWIPLTAGPAAQFLPYRGNHSLVVVGRLAEGISLAAAQQEMDALMARLEETYPDDNRGRGAWVQPLREAFAGSVRGALVTLLAAVLMVLVVACVNVANLLLSRTMARHREVAIRGALGAGRARVARQFLLESLLLALPGGALGIGLAYGLLRLLRALGAGILPGVASIQLDLRVLAVALGISLATGVLFGLTPALYASRINLQGHLKEDARSFGPGRRHLLRRALVVAELAIALMLVVGAGLLIRSFERLQQVEPGFQPQQLISVQVQLPESTYPQQRETHPDWPQVIAFADQLAERAAALPEVQSASISYLHPMEPGWTTRFTIDGRPEVDPGERDETRIRPISPGYLRTAGIKLLAGRDLGPADHEGAPPVTLINQAMARAYFPDQDPVGQRITLWDRSREIVGVVADVKFRGLDRQVPIAIYPPFRQVPFSQITLLASTASELASVVPQLRSLVADLDPDLPLHSAASLDEVLSDSLAEARFGMVLLSLFAVIGLILAAVGTYGLVAHGVSRRVFEIGLRQTLGASRRDIQLWVLARGLRLAALGVAIGLVGALAISRTMSSLLFEISAQDPWIYASVAIILLVVAVAASLLPAWRASRVEPVATLRHE